MKNKKSKISLQLFAGVALLANLTVADAAPSSYQTAVLADSPNVYYRLGEASGTVAADASGNAYAGTYVATPTLGATGANGGDTAVTFNGSSQYVNSTATNFGPTLATSSYEFVFKTSSTARGCLGGVIDLGSKDAYVVTVNENAAGSATIANCRIFLRSGNAVDAVGASFANTAITNGVYHHLVFVYNSSGGSSRVRAYLDGVPQTITYGGTTGSGAPSSFSTTITNTPLFGARHTRTGTPQVPSVDFFYNGTIDEAALYPTSLSAAAVATHYQAFLDAGNNLSTNLAWAVGNGTWDVNTTVNWTNGTAMSVYSESNGIGNRVAFNDTATGSSPIAISLNTTVNPASITNNSTKNYILSGAGNLAGSTGLSKLGSGTLTLDLSGTSTFSGPVNLLGGVLAFSANNLGATLPPPIIFNGGTLSYNGVNADDISLNSVTFSNNANIDVGANNVTFTKPVGNSGAGGLTKSGSGTLTLTGANKYTGNTVVSNGTLTLAFSTFITNSPAIIVNSGAVLDAASYAIGLALKGSPAQIIAGVGTINGTVISSNGVITPGTNGVIGTLAFGNDVTIAGGSLMIDLSTNSAHRDLITVGGNLSLYGGTLQLNVTGTLTNGVYRLIQYSGSLLSGAASSGSLSLAGYSQPGKVLVLSDTVNANEIDLVVSSAGGVNVVWQGDGGNNYWDVATSANFTNSGGTALVFNQGDNPTFNDTSVNPTVNLNANLLPGSVTVTANANNYVLQDGTGTGGGLLSGSAGITKNGSSTLTIATANLNSGPTVINGGTVQVGNGGNLGDLGSGDVTNNGALVFYQSNDHTVSGSINGTGGVTQQGGGTVTLAANNSYAGPTTISSGTLRIGNGSTTGTLGSYGTVTNNGNLAFNRSTVDTLTNVITGSGTFSVNSGTLTLTAANSYAGGTVVNGGKLIAGNASTIPTGLPLTVQSGGTNDLNGFNLIVSGLGSTANSGGRIVNNAGTATNVLTINHDDIGTAADSSIAIADNDGSGGKVALVKTGAGKQHLRGTSTYTGGTVVSNGTLVIRATSALGTGPVLLRGGNMSVYSSPTIANSFIAETNASFLTESAGNATFQGSFTTSSNLTFNFTGLNQTWTFEGGASQLSGVTGTIYITGTSTSFFRFNTSLGSTSATFDMTGSAVALAAVSANTYQLGALVGDGTAGIRGPAGTVWAVGAKNLDTTFTGSLGNGTATNSLLKIGTGRLTLGGAFGFAGQTTVSNGVLAIVEPTSLDTSVTIKLGASAAILDVSGRTDGTLNLGNSTAQTLTGFGTINGSVNEAANSTVIVGLGTLTVTNVATLNGALTMQLNRTNVVNASKLVAGSLINASALTVTNVGPALQGGDTFQLFNTAVTGFTVTNLPTLTGSMYWTNNLAVNGTIAVVNLINPNPPVMGISVSGGVLTLSWPTNAGWTLQQQTNSITKGLGTNWVDVPGSTSITSTNITMDPSKPTVFYRLKM